MGNEKKMMISHKIVMRLAEKGWRQSDLSRKSGIRHGTINACVNRGSKPRGMTLIKMAKGLDLDPEYLIEDSKDWPPSPEDRVVPQPGHKNTGPPRPYETAPLPHFGHIVAGDPTLRIIRRGILS
jgi:lambda repressor-like predicted transcriptional regulator